MAMYRIYIEIEDDYGCRCPTRIGHTMANLKKATDAALHASEVYGVAELKDDSRSLKERLLAVFRKGHKVGA